MDHKNEPILSAATKMLLKEAVEEGRKTRTADSVKEAQDFHDMFKRQQEAKTIRELGVLHEALQENFHIVPAGSWGKSIILVAAEIIQERGKERPLSEAAADAHRKKELLRLKDNNVMAIYELERLQKSLGFKNNGYVDMQFKQIIDILKDEDEKGRPE